ncbi:MAG: 4Fe-4S binding protein [Deltaproteobacteria bacterium]|nr:MAG: 4Fe-4S binding protein [Deltaproteobacteria bacterium]
MTSKKDKFISACATLARGEAGRTGDWRAKRPIIDLSKCTPCKTGKPSCYLCWLYCPDGTVGRGMPVEIDLTYCKGCGICAEVCPTKAISMEVEEDFLDADCGGRTEAERVPGES